MKTVDPFESQEVSYNSTVEAKESLTTEKEIKRSRNRSQSQDTDGDIELESSFGIPPYQPGGAVSQISDPVGEESYINIIPPTLPTPLRKREAETGNIYSPFPQSSTSFSDLSNPNFLNENDVDEAELLGLCSGKFSSQPAEISQDESINSNSYLTSTLCLENKFDQMEPTDVEHLKSSAKPSLQSSKLFQSREEKCLANTHDNRALVEKEIIHDKNTSAIQRKKYVVVSSSDDDGDDDKEKSKNKLQKKLHKKLQFSDDEDENEEKSSNKWDDNSDSDDADDHPEEPQEVEYDSEENEVIVKPSTAKDFFENEAELSESEWGSADEDEKGLDDFEIEEGDDETLDQSKVRSQLEKIHLRRVLDEDQQEIKRLQELLLEDGEFHSEGGGRQRQFRWKNLDDKDDLQSLKKTDDDVPYDGDEEEDESEWRRMRFEREVFLQEHKKSLEKDEELLNAVKLKFKSPLVIPKKGAQVKRGSFLTRSEAALARIAQITKNSTEINISGPTNSRNFVFTTLSQDPKVDDKQGIKRKALKVEAPVPKRMRGSLLDQLG